MSRFRRVQQCRLCGSPIEATLSNPRRVCAACGEVNLPGDEAPPASPDPAPALRPLPASTHKPPPLRIVVAVTVLLVPLALLSTLVAPRSDTLVLFARDLLQLLATCSVSLLCVSLFLRARTPPQQVATLLATSAATTFAIGMALRLCFDMLLSQLHF